MRFKVGIPARYGAQRLPGKPLADIAGKPMIQRVFEAASASGAEEIVIATDDERIAVCARAFGAQVCMTASTHRSGTERLAEAARRLGWHPEDIVVNLQGDEPLISPLNIRQVAGNLHQHSQAEIATLRASIDEPAELQNPNVVKVVTDAADFALYFSRACIPGGEAEPSARLWYRHIGLYAYRVGYLRAFPELQVSPLESQERLEQLRALWHGARIHVAVAVAPSAAGVDTQEDVQRVSRLLGGG